LKGRGGLVVNSRLRSRRPYSTEDPPYSKAFVAWCHGGLLAETRIVPKGRQFETKFPQRSAMYASALLKSNGIKHPQVSITWRFGNEVPSQVSFSSSYHSWKLRSPS
ncbi:hypothetical protein AVEN_4633-1, partial [Araneus ventricosus]